MFKYVDICVEMKAGRKCKDALINYRNACQQVGSDLRQPSRIFNLSAASCVLLELVTQLPSCLSQVQPCSQGLKRMERTCRVESRSGKRPS